MGRYGGERRTHDAIDWLVFQAWWLGNFCAWANARRWQG